MSGDLLITPETGHSARLLCVSLAITASVVCLGVLFVPEVLTGTPVMNGSARGTALTALVVAVPALATSLVLISRGSLRAVPVWIGSIAYLLYNSVLFLFATPFDDLFLGYVVMASLSLWSLIVALCTVDFDRFAARFSPTTPIRPVAGYIVVIVALNALAWLVPVAWATTSGGPPAFLDGTGLTTNPIYVQDLVFWLPALATSAWWLWHGKSRGYLLVATGLAFWVIEGIGVGVDQWLGSAADPSSTVASAAMTPAFFLLALATSVSLVAMLRGLPAANETLLHTPPKSKATWTLIAVQLLVGVMAAVGGVRMMVDGFDLPVEWLSGTGFDSWFLPGLALIVGVAVPQLTTAALTLSGHGKAITASWLAGLLLVLWIVIQLAVLERYFILQPVVALLGVAELALATYLGGDGRQDTATHIPNEAVAAR